MLYFSQNINKKNLKISKLQSHRLSSFSTFKKTVTDVKVSGDKFVLFLWLFLSVHQNFQYKLNSHKSLFIITVNLFSSIAILIFSHLQFHFLFLLFFFINSMNMNKWVLFKKKQININCLRCFLQNRLQKYTSWNSFF